MSKTLCFTGHRPSGLFGYGLDTPTQERYNALTKELVDILHDLHQKRFSRFITGGAQGADQLAFWAVDFIKDYYLNDTFENVVYVPCKGQDSRWKEDGRFGKREYYQMLKKATEVVYISEGPYQGPWTMTRRNHAMVDASDAVLAIYGASEDWHTAKGGTAECMRYAEKRDKPIIIFNPFTNEVKYPENDLGGLL